MDRRTMESQCAKDIAEERRKVGPRYGKQEMRDAYTRDLQQERGQIRAQL